jgi:hypothetical protein
MQTEWHCDVQCPVLCLPWRFFQHNCVSFTSSLFLSGCWQMPFALARWAMRPRLALMCCYPVLPADFVWCCGVATETTGLMHSAPWQGALECVYLPYRGVLQGQVQGRAPPEGPGVAVVGPLRWMNGERLELLACCTSLYLYSADCLGVPACSCPKCTHLLHSSGVGGESNGGVV